ncbi:MAG: NADH-quinone oxidoreductase subunit J [Bacteroidetes bacterium]|nr:NADH-quinone oxidoreductase subunit J [Bacteroidota bacterium]
MLGYTITQWLFGILSFLAVMFALLVVFSKNPVHSVLYLVLTFFCIAGHYLLMNAQFLAIVHIAVYAGAIMVLFLFVIMLLNLNEQHEPRRTSVSRIIGVIVAGLFLMVLVGVLKGTEQLQLTNTANAEAGLIKNLGQVLFNEFLFPFEIVSILLLAALVGAIMLGKKEVKENVNENRI